MSSATQAGPWTAVATDVSSEAATAEAAAGVFPECVVLDAREPETGPPVRIYLGTEAAQYRAERVFVWSIDRVRSASRRYEIYLLRDLPGYDHLGWTTGFTNHRFAVPHYAGGRGVAIYNDVDQIYLRDPAELFDLDLDGHGYLAIAERETSVMLLDCARMVRVWSLAEAQHRSKRALIRKALEVRGLFGPLDPGWNCRDEDEYSVASACCYHFTTLHTQPWRPFPERFVYHEHPHASLWWDLKASADAAQYNVFDRARPSARYARASVASLAPRAAHGDRLASLLARSGSTSARAFTAGGEAAGPLPPALQSPDLRVEPTADLLRLDGTGELEATDAVVCLGGLDAVPDDDAPWVIGELFRSARRALFVSARQSVSRRTAPWRSPAGGMRGRTWWLDQTTLAAKAAPDVEWELALEPDDGGPRELHRGGPWRADRPPRVWLVTDDSPGAAAQARALAQALGWPSREWRLDFGPASAAAQRVLGAGAWCEWSDVAPRGLPSEATSATEWPDLVIAAGNRTAPAVRWLRRRADRPCRTLQIDCGGVSPADDFDLVVTPVSAGALAHPRRTEIAGPLLAGPARERPAWVEDWRAACEGRPTWLLIDADWPPDRVGPLLEESIKGASPDGALGVSIHRDAPPALESAVRAFAPGARALPRWCTDDSEAADWAAALERADRLVLATRDPVLAAAARAAGRPVEWVSHPVGETPRKGLRDRLVGLAFARPENDRGTTRPQMGVERLFSWLVARGILLPSPRPELAVRRLREGGSSPSAELERLAARVRGWFPAP